MSDTIAFTKAMNGVVAVENAVTLDGDERTDILVFTEKEELINFIEWMFDDCFDTDDDDDDEDADFMQDYNERIRAILDSGE